MTPVWPDEEHLTGVDYTVIDPFQNFKFIPAKIRYRFMIENAKLILDFFTRGPVCSGGSAATYVVQDHSWLFFLDPNSDVSLNYPNYFDLVSDNLVTPTMSFPERGWAYYKKKSRRYEDQHAALLSKFRPKGYSAQDIWNGDGSAA